jgi:hypothetical protein
MGYMDFADERQCVFWVVKPTIPMKAQDILCPYTATIGIDWADSKHDVFERYVDGSICQHQIASTPEAVGQWLWALRRRAKGGRVAIGVETYRGPLFHSLSQHLDWIDNLPCQSSIFSSLSADVLSQSRQG